MLRALFGIGMGGEWGVGASLAMEKVPPRWRGFLSGLLQEGYSVGYLLAACCYFTVFPTWGWRAMFFIGGLPALLAIFVRYRVKESAVWQKTRHKDWSGLGRAIVANWKLFLYLTALMMMMNFASHGTQDMYPTFLKEQRGFTPRQVATIAIIYNIGRCSAVSSSAGCPINWATARDGGRFVAGDRDGSLVGLCARNSGARGGGVSAAIHGSGRVGGDTGPHY